ncbi:oxidoreductase GLYR1 [Trichonephila clavipes]|nr:oxidoreductase GLYR1 [Trichonephila clavipes]
MKAWIKRVYRNVNYRSYYFPQTITQKGAKYLEAPINGLKINAEDPPPILAAKDHGLFTSCLSCFRTMSKDSYYMDCDVGKCAKMNILLVR